MSAREPALLQHHSPATEVCFGAAGARDAGQLWALVERVTLELAGLPPNAGILLATRDRYLFAAAMLAVLREGHVVVLPESTQATSVSACRERLGAARVLHDLPDLPGERDISSLDDPGARVSALPSFSRALTSKAFVALTSGSTGTPTAHEKTLGQLLIEADTHGRTFELGGARVVSAAPAHHIYGLLFGVLLPLLRGGSMLRETPLFPQELISSLATHGARALVAVPAHLSALSREEDGALPPTQRAFSSAGPLPPAVANALAERGMPITEIFGATELGGVASRCSPQEPWQPMPGVEVRCGAGEQLEVRSAWCDAGEGAWTRTSDRIALLEGGGFRHLGRADAVVKVGGRRVDLRDLELQLARAEGVEEARVLAIHHEGAARDTSLWAVVAGRGVTVEALREQLAQRFNHVTWPRRYRLVERLPRNDAGKTTRASLLALFEDPETRTTPPPGPAGDDKGGNDD